MIRKRSIAPRRKLQLGYLESLEGRALLSVAAADPSDPSITPPVDVAPTTQSNSDDGGTDSGDANPASSSDPNNASAGGGSSSADDGGDATNGSDGNPTVPVYPPVTGSGVPVTPASTTNTGAGTSPGPLAPGAASPSGGGGSNAAGSPTSGSTPSGNSDPDGSDPSGSDGFDGSDDGDGDGSSTDGTSSGDQSSGSDGTSDPSGSAGDLNSGSSSSSGTGVSGPTGAKNATDPYLYLILAGSAAKTQYERDVMATENALSGLDQARAILDAHQNRLDDVRAGEVSCLISIALADHSDPQSFIGYAETLANLQTEDLSLQLTLNFDNARFVTASQNEQLAQQKEANDKAIYDSLLQQWADTHKLSNQPCPY